MLNLQRSHSSECGEKLLYAFFTFDGKKLTRAEVPACFDQFDGMFMISYIECLKCLLKWINNLC